MSNFSKLQRRILASLEEAGEDYIAGLANTVLERHGSFDEVKSYRDALSDLVQGNFLEIARARDPNSLRWIRLSKPQAMAILTELNVLFNWSAADRLWNWTGEPRIPIRTVVLLTDSGLTAARDMLSQGWTPERDLEWLKKHGESSQCD